MGSFARGGTVGVATCDDKNGNVRVAGVSDPRIGYFGSQLGLLLEPTRSNRVIQPSALATTWAQTGTPLPTNAVGTYAGLSFSRLAFTTNWATDYIASAADLGYTGNGQKVFLIHAKQDGANAGTFEFFIKDTSAAATRLDGTLTVAAGGAITCVIATGTLLATVPLANGVYRFIVQSATITAANTNKIFLGSGVGTCPSILLTGLDTGDVTGAASPILQTSAALTRSAEPCSFAANWLPASVTLYGKFVDFSAGGTMGLWQLGNNANAFSKLQQYCQGSNYQCAWAPDGSGASSLAGVGTVFGAVIELRAVLDATGLLTHGVTINGGAENISVAGVARAFPAAWTVPILELGSFGSSLPGSMLAQSLRAAAGVRSLAYMQAA